MTDESALPDEIPPRATVFGLLCKVLAGVLVGLVAADLLAGSVDAERDLRGAGALQQDEQLGWVPRPGYSYNDGVTTINALGMRSSEIPADAPPHELRVLGVGASRIFGSGTPQNELLWSGVLQALLRSEGADARVLNAGVNGYSALQASRRAMQLTPVVRPDLILLFVSPASQSLLDASGASNWTWVGDEIAPRDVAEAAPAPLAPLVVALHKALLNSNLYSRHRARVTADRNVPEELRHFVLTHAPPPEAARPYLADTWREIRSLAEHCSRRGIVLRVVVLPTPFQGNEALWHGWLAEKRPHGGPPLDLPRAEPTRALAEQLRALDLDVWVLDDAIEKIGSDLDYYTVDQQHWTKFGNRVIAVALLDRLRAEEGLLQELVARRRADPRD